MQWTTDARRAAHASRLLLCALVGLFIVGGTVAQDTGASTVFPIEVKAGAAVRERLGLDLETARSAIDAARLSPEEKARLLAEAESLQARVDAVPEALPPGFRAIMPFDELQARIFALNAPVLRARGFRGLCAWAQNRWDPLQPTWAPTEPPATPQLTVALMRGEYRAQAVNLTNATDVPVSAQVTLSGLPGGSNPGWVTVHEVLFTDTYIHYPIAAALPVAQRSPQGYTVTIPSGMTRQVWLTFHPTDQEPGSHIGTIDVQAPGLEPIHIPLSVRLYPFEMPAVPSIAVGGWDYTHGDKSAFDAGALDQAAYIRFLREHGVNTTWSAGIPFDKCEFDAEGTLTRPMDFSVWDAWVARWPGAAFYAHFLGVGDSLCGEKSGTARFRRMVGQWVDALVVHAAGQGIRPEQLALLLVDEPVNADQEAIVTAWAEAVRAAQPRVVIWEDPCRPDPREAAPAFYAACDVLSPSAARFVDAPQSYRDFFVEQREAGRELWFYSCVNGKHLDPYTYHRGQFWLAIRYGARGSCYWAFGDEGRAGSSFAAYTSPGHMFSPLFLDPEMGLIDGKHMQAIREGAQDYEYFTMLRARVAELRARGVDTPQLQAAARLLDEGPRRVAEEITLERIEWRAPKARGAMDEVRVEALAALEALRGI